MISRGSGAAVVFWLPFLQQRAMAAVFAAVVFWLPFLQQRPKAVHAAW
jgi:hypothetical protein